MKRLIVFVFLLLPICSLFFIRGNISSFYNIEGVTKACLVTAESVDVEKKIEALDYNYIFVERDDIADSISKIKPECVILFFENTPFEKISKSLNMLELKREKIGDKEVVYGFTSKYQGGALLKNKKYNVQVLIEKNKIVLGFPRIITGF